MPFKFKDKHIIITGGTGALGWAVTGLLLGRNAKISIPCYDESELQQFEHASHHRLFLQTGIDLTNEEATEMFYRKAVEKHGSLWGSIHIAGGFGMEKIENTDKADFMKQINLNLVTCFNACKAAILHMRRNDGGRIANIASRPGLEARHGAGMSAYTVSKAGVAALTRSLAAEVVADNILINAVAPSIIDTPQNREAMSGADFEKWPKPEEIAAHIVYLISDRNMVTRGAVIPVYGKS